MHAIKRLWNKYIKKERENLKVLGRYDGHMFYALDALPNYAVGRFFHFVKKNEEIDKLKLPIEYILAVADQLEALNESPNLKRTVPVLIEFLRLFCKNADTKWLSLTHAIVEAFILVDDEDILHMSDRHNQLKLEIFRNNPDARFFFINIASDYLNRLVASFNNLNLEDCLNNLIVEEGLLGNIMTPTTKDI